MMYFAALNEWAGLSPLDRQQAEQCAARGGTPIIRTRFVPSANALPGYMTGSEEPYFAGCQLPQAVAPQPAPAQISVNVPTNVNTQVSPQISPAFVQQDQPQNSPVSTAASANPEQSTGGAEFAEYMRQIEESRAMRDAQVMDYLRQIATPAAVPASPVMVAPPADVIEASAAPLTLAERVNKNVLPLALAAAAFVSILAFLKRKK